MTLGGRPTRAEKVARFKNRRGPVLRGILKPNMRFYIQNYGLYRTDREYGHKGGNAVAVNKGIPHTFVHLPPLLSAESAGLCMLIGNSEMLFGAVYKSPQILWSDTNITVLLPFRKKSILICDLNAKHPVWNSKI
jgi:hypothetical protein